MTGTFLDPHTTGILLDEIRKITVRYQGQEASVARMASWAVWPNEGVGDIAPKDQQIRDFGVRTDVVFIAFNWGANLDDIPYFLHEDEPDWANFHANPGTGKWRTDFRTLRRAFWPDASGKTKDSAPERAPLVRRKVGGAYLTDVFKMAPTKQSGGLTGRDRKMARERSVPAFEDEMRALWRAGAQKPLMLALGTAAHGELKRDGDFAEAYQKVFSEELASRLHYVRHYSNGANVVDIRDHILSHTKDLPNHPSL